VAGITALTGITGGEGGMRANGHMRIAALVVVGKSE
jgi:hypothetical protein